MATFNAIIESINNVIWHDTVILSVLIIGTVFMVLFRFSPLASLVHGFQIIRGKYDKDSDPGAITHFQALSTALSGTVGLGNIGGVAVAISLGGPGAVFWMWVVGLIGMALKTVEVCLSMLYRNTDDKDNPHGGPMWVAHKGFAEMGYPTIGKIIASIFCITLFVSAVTGGNMFQAWNVAKVTHVNFGVPELVTGMILMVISGTVIIGGIKRIGQVAGSLVPFMLGAYFLSAFYVIVTHFTSIPAAFALILQAAFNPLEAQGAFIGGTVGYAFMWGMKRALFSNEAGQGSAPIAHCAARTKEPIREGVVAGLEPFVDTLIVCTITALVVILSGAWNRDGVFQLPVDQQNFEQTTSTQWTLPPSQFDLDGDIKDKRFVTEDTLKPVMNGEQVYVVYQTEGGPPARVFGRTEWLPESRALDVTWETVESAAAPVVVDGSVHINLPGAALTSHAFDRVHPGLGKWLVTLAAWLFAISTIISWSYYGEQGWYYLAKGEKGILVYKLIYCILILVSTSGIVQTDRELDGLTSLGTGVMLLANIPIMIIFSRKAFREYFSYMRRLKAGEFD